MITNWFSIAAGVSFFCAVAYGIHVGQDLKLIILFLLLGCANVIMGTI